MNNIIERVWHQNKMVKIEDLRGMAFQAEAAGHTFQISGVDKDGNALALSGTVSGVFLRPDNTDVAITGAASGGVVSVTLPAECYDVPGRFGLTVYVSANGEKVAVYAAMGTVSRASSGTVSPGTVGDVVDLINRINAAVQTIPASWSGLMADIAPDYSDTAVYPLGAYVYYNGDLYRSTTAITTAETWTAAHWTAAVLGDDVTGIKTALGDFFPIIHGSYTNSVWNTNNYSVFIAVRPGASVTLTAGNTAATYGGLNITGSVPPAVGDTAVYSTETGWTSFKSVTKNTTVELTIPSDVNYFYLYLGATTLYAKKPTVLIIDGIDYFGSAVSNILAVDNKLVAAKEEIYTNIQEAETDIQTIQTNIQTIETDIQSANAEIDSVENELQLYPYGVLPYQMALFVPSANLFSEFCYHITGSYYRYQNDTTKKYPRAYHAPGWQGWLIRVKPNTTYAIGPIDYRIEFLKGDGTLDTRFETYSDTEPNIITTGASSYWMCLTEKDTRDMSDWMMVEGSTYPEEYISGYPQWVAEPLSSKDSRSKTIAFMGDSITAGVGATKVFHQYLHDKYGWTCLNYGFGGAGFYRNSASNSSGRIGMGVPGRGVPTTPENFFTPNNVLARLAEVDASAIDGIVIFAGTNDYGNNVSIEDYTTAIDNVFDYCQTNFPTKPVLAMTPIHRRNGSTPNNTGKNLREYADILVTECEKYGIAYVDTMTMSGIHPDNDANRAAYFTVDTGGLHPDHNGHKRIASVVGDMIAQVISYTEFS